MNDPILPDAQQPEASSAPQAPDRMDRLEAAMADLAATVRDAAQRVTSIQAPPSGSAVPRSSEEFLSELANDPRGLMERVASEQVSRQVSESLTPAVLQVLDMASQQLVTKAELQVDSEFGAGTFNEIFRPQLEKDLAQLRQVNPRAMADQGTMDALVSRLYGGANFHKLTERRRNLEQNGGNPMAGLVPTGGIPRLRGTLPDELPQDVEQFLRDIERTQGEAIDRKHFNKMYRTGRESGPGRHRTTVLEWLQAVGADPDTKKMYGGS